MNIIQLICKRLRNIFLKFYNAVDPVGYARMIGVKIGVGCRLIDVTFDTEPYLIEIGDHVSISNTRFVTHDGGVWVFRNLEPGIDLFGRIKIGNNVFIGTGTIILPGVTVGDNVVIGAGSVVTKDIPSDCVAVGVPARPLKSLKEYQDKCMPKVDYTKQMSAIEKRKYLVKKYRL